MNNMDEPLIYTETEEEFEGYDQYSPKGCLAIILLTVFAVVILSIGLIHYFI